MRRSRWLIPLLSFLLIFFGWTKSASAQSPEYVLQTDFTDTGASTWNPSLLVIDVKRFASPSSVILRVTNSSDENVGFVIEELGIHEHIPALHDITIRLPIEASGVYKFYSDRHPPASSSEMIGDTRPHVPGWLVIGNVNQGDHLYLGATRQFGDALSRDLRVLQRESMHSTYLPALVEGCEDLLDHLEWSTRHLWLSARSTPHPPVLYWIIHDLVREEIIPTFAHLRLPIDLPTESWDALLEQAIAKLWQLQELLAMVKAERLARL